VAFMCTDVLFAIVTLFIFQQPQICGGETGCSVATSLFQALKVKSQFRRIFDINLFRVYFLN